MRTCCYRKASHCAREDHGIAKGLKLKFKVLTQGAASTKGRDPRKDVCGIFGSPRATSHDCYDPGEKPSRGADQPSRTRSVGCHTSSQTLLHRLALQLDAADCASLKPYRESVPVLAMDDGHLCVFRLGRLRSVLLSQCFLGDTLFPV